MIDVSAGKWHPRRIAIFRALQLGDLLQAVPALRAIRAGFPGAEITFIGLPWARSFVQRFQRYIDRFVEFVGFPGIPELEFIPERTARFIDAQRRYGYDLAIQMQGSGGVANRFICALKAGVTAGYYQGESSEGLTIGAPYPDNQPEVYRNLGLAQLLGCRACVPELEFPLYDSDYAEAAALLHIFPHAARPLIGLHSGARPPARRWPTAYFASVADELVRLFGAQIILTGGTDETEIVHSTEEQMTTQPINLAGKTSLGGLAALINKLDLFISNDTGPAHLAYAVGTPSITIFGPADYRRWAPLNQELHRIVRHPVVCSPCSYLICPIDHRCLRGVSPAMVIETARDLLAKGAVA
ncbi:MAG TPA: glycosyltransferase family 9 protein [Ktedonobacteraceae bacterium]|nr:glycosyltransferase family 9 protein [Ktedonobacteraceae bacterium]